MNAKVKARERKGMTKVNIKIKERGRKKRDGDVL
jgi:hypothetical protein